MKKKKLIYWVATNSFSIVRYSFGTIFMLVCLCFIFESSVPKILLPMLIFISGVFFQAIVLLTIQLNTYMIGICQTCRLVNKS